MDLYNFNPLTPNEIKHGINIIFWRNIVESKNKEPLAVPNVNIIDDIVYPKQKPLNKIIKYTITIPITVEPINHSDITKLKFLKTDSLSKSNLSISLPVLKFNIEVCK